MTEPAMAEDRTPLRWWEIVLGVLAPILGFAALGVLVSFLGGCAYKGGKVIDGTNLAIGMTIPGTEWTINALDYVGGVRVAGNDSTHIVVHNEVSETNSFFGVVHTFRHTKMSADIEPLVSEDAETSE